MSEDLADKRVEEGSIFPQRSWLEVVREEATKVNPKNASMSDSAAEYILFEGTGFPEFWNIPQDGNTAEECCRTQVREFLTRKKDPNESSE